MTALFNSRKYYSGALAGIDISGAILNPSALFTAYKNRVVADGGTIIDEAATLDEITFLVNNGMWERVSAWAGASFGVKIRSGTTSQVDKLYGLSGSPDFSAVAVAPTGSPVISLITGTPNKLAITLVNGGVYLKSTVSSKAQSAPGVPYLISARLEDRVNTDQLGMTISFADGTTNKALARQRTILTNAGALNEAWQFFASNVNPPVSGSDVGSGAQTPYSAFANCAGLIDPVAGKVIGYGNGVALHTGTSSSGALADLSNTSGYWHLGPADSSVPTGQSCYGYLANIRCLNIASALDAQLISNRA
ncbi:hypothetical protein [Serratia nematodiphila]|uniref:hypothetical protein n=1 Tax=Serratia nematodiphila TaxID=458197 RepID=UPI0011D5CC2C|nr:hypothetical protein [Serratia nematodiphila]TXE58160.1 hypothetical protein FOT58_19145 [Serratia nematodiphila]